MNTGISHYKSHRCYPGLWTLTTALVRIFSVLCCGVYDNQIVSVRDHCNFLCTDLGTAAAFFKISQEIFSCSSTFWDFCQTGPSMKHLQTYCWGHTHSVSQCATAAHCSQEQSFTSFWCKSPSTPDISRLETRQKCLPTLQTANSSWHSPGNIQIAHILNKLSVIASYPEATKTQQLNSFQAVHKIHYCTVLSEIGHLFSPQGFLNTDMNFHVSVLIISIFKVQNPSMPNDEGITPLHNAVCAGHHHIVKFLLDFGVNVNAADSDGWSVLLFSS